VKKNNFYTGFNYHQDFKQGMSFKYKKVSELITNDQSILEIGCHTGDFGKVLKMKGNKVWGVEINSDAAKKARPFYEKILIGDIEEPDIWDAMSQKFDVILFLDVLEHLVNPWKVLVKTKEFLNSNGCLLITLPNIAFYAVRRSLLFGRFDYRKSGILDRSHLRFFTFYSAKKMIQDCGYGIQEWYATLSELPFEHRLLFLGKFYGKCKPLFLKAFPNLFGAVMLFKTIPVK
jgi:2-polyprenyl-3-methyl-5-hydroxy-6-metoxy-1,4-benzoquinol methylase